MNGLKAWIKTLTEILTYEKNINFGDLLFMYGKFILEDYPRISNEETEILFKHETRIFLYQFGIRVCDEGNNTTWRHILVECLNKRNYSVIK